MHIRIGDHSNQSRHPGEDGMIGMDYDSGIEFGVGVYPTRDRQLPEQKKMLENITKA
jgi:hypothetical protein